MSSQASQDSQSHGGGHELPRQLHDAAHAQPVWRNRGLSRYEVNAMNKSFVFALSLLLLLCGWNVRAEQFVEDDAYVVHYSAFNSTLLQPEVAKAYDLMRSRQRAV